MSEDTVTETTEAAEVSEAPVAYTQEDVDAIRAEADERVARAEAQRKRANTEAANRRHREKELTEQLNSLTGQEGATATEVVNRIAAIEAENRAWKIDDLTRQAAQMAGVDTDLALPWLRANGKLEGIDVSDRQAAFNQIDAEMKQFAERYPTAVNKVDPVPQQPWGTPGSVDKGSPPADIVAYLERVADERPEDLQEEWDKYDGDRFIKQMGYDI